MTWLKPLAILLAAGSLIGALGTGLVGGIVGASYSNVPAGPAIFWTTLSVMPFALPVLVVAGILWWISNDPRGEN